MSGYNDVLTYIAFVTLLKLICNQIYLGTNNIVDSTVTANRRNMRAD